MTIFRKNKIFLTALNHHDFKNHGDLGYSIILRTLLFLLCILSVQTLNAQRGGAPTGRPTNGGAGNGGGQQGIQFADDESPDTSKVYYFFTDNPNKEYLFVDTLLDNYFHQYDPARKRELDYAQLGNIGSPLNQFIYQPSFHQGFDIGLHQYDPYKVTSKSLKFYNIEKAFTDFYFSQGGSQEDIQLNAKFSQDFAKGTKLSIDYRRISQFGGTTPIPYLYENQKARHTDLAIGLSFKNQKETYQSYLVFATNIHQQNDNGGIQADSFFLQQTSGLESTLNIPVWLSSASTRHDEREVNYTQYFIFGKKNKKATPPLPPVDTLLQNRFDSLSTNSKDSLQMDSLGQILKDTLPPSPIDSLKQIPQDSLGKRKPVGDLQSRRPSRQQLPNNRRTLPYSPPQIIDDTGRKFTLAHSITYRSGKYKFAAVPPDTASAYWNNLLVDKRGLRHYLEMRQLENSFDISTFKKRKSKGSNRVAQNDLLQVGITHTLSRVDEEAADSTINNLFLKGKWNFNPNEKLKVETYAHFGLWDNAGDYRINGDLFFNLYKLGQLQLTATNQLYKPNLLQQRIYISQRPAWQNDFGRTVETSLAATYAYPKIKFKASGQYHLLNNFIYYDTLATPQQFGGAMSILQLTLSQDLQFRAFHLDNVVTFQTTTESVLRLPSFYSKHSLYYIGRWFKKALNIRLGVDVRMNNTYFANTYNPLIGQFHLQEKNEVDFYPVLDAVVSIKVKQFRFFFKWENFTRWRKPFNEKYYQVANYPVLDKSIRFGLAWRFSN